MMRMYADYNFYVMQFDRSGSQLISGLDFPYYAGMASAKMDYLAQGKITGELQGKDEVKSCCCAVAEALYRYDQATDNPAAAPVTSWSNDGESGSYAMDSSSVTEEGLNRKVMQVMRTYLWKYGALYRGVRHA